MKFKTLALLTLAAAVALVPHLLFAMIWLTSDSTAARPTRPAPQVAVNVGQPRGFFAMPDPFEPVVQRGQVISRDELKAIRGPVVPLSECTVSEPIAQGNLSVYLIHGRDTLKGQRVITLQSALEQNLAVVHEGAIAIDNRANMPLFIQAGDIIKGGNQDRTLPYDQLVPPGQRLSVPVFCVEAGRSGPRGQEISHSFQSATEQLPGKSLHLAARHLRSQADVWARVQHLQQGLAANVGGSVQSPVSQTSLQLTLEHPRVQEAVAAYLNELSPRMGGDDVIGMAVAVNGQIQSADIYASAGLFRELLPKVLKANAVAALAERKEGAPATPPTAEAMQKFLERVARGDDCRHDQGEGTAVLRQESAQGLLFDTCDRNRQNLVLHRSFLAK